MEYALAILILATLVALVVTAPLRRGGEPDPREDVRRAELEAAKQAKYREIRDAELDFRMGKVSEADYRATDRELRGQAIAILEELDQLETGGGNDDHSAEDRPPVAGEPPRDS